MDETWIGATVEAIRGSDQGAPYREGDILTVEELRGNQCFKSAELPYRFSPLFKNFTLVKKADERPPLSGSFTMKVDESSEARDALRALYEESQKHQQTRTEVTHSAELEFPNGERVNIPPPPKSEGWEAETLWDDSEWPHRYYRDDMSIHGDWFTHQSGKIIFDEYKNRAFKERPRIVSLTKWSREVVEVGNEVEEMNRAAVADMQWAEQRETDLVNSTWPERHPPGGVKYGEE